MEAVVALTGMVAAVDIGGTKIAAAAVTSDDRILSREIAVTPATEGPDAVLALVADLVTRLVDRVGPIDAVGVGTAGAVDPVGGRIVSATAAISGWTGTRVADGLAARLHLPVAVDNDVHAHLIGELTADPARSGQTVLLVAVGTGIGGSLAIHGRVHRGARHVAGHVGHVPIPGAEGCLCPCGGVGHAEAVASGPALVASYRRRTGDALADLVAVCERATDGDPATRRTC